MIAQPQDKYRRFKPIELSDRQWPNKVISQPPVWMSTDLRDGNQALIDPMSVETKLRFFKALVAMGFKEIEVGFPSASETDFNVVRRLIEENLIPDDVTIEVLTQAREDLIERTVKSLKGARRAILHMYNPTAPDFREIVYRTDKAGVRGIAEQGTRWVKQYTAQQPETEWVYQYSPEAFSSTELEFAKEVCDAVSAIWQPTPAQKMIFNLPATVEMSTPNTYADQIEWMHRNLNNRDAIVLSVHPHNDRGTAVAAAELAVMAGADRVEGCLFGNGERTGNVCLVTLALNLYSQGIHPGLDFSNIDQIRQLVESCTNLPVHPRHPYAGELVFTAFSGSHQDAIKKGFAAQTAKSLWNIPYLPLDPADLGRSYDAVVRVNSQSGKGGVSFLLQQQAGFELPRRLQIEFSKIVQLVSDETSKEINASAIYQLFDEAYLQVNQPYTFRSSKVNDDNEERVTADISLQHNGHQLTLSGQGNGPLDAAAVALSHHLGEAITVVDYHEHGIGSGSDAMAVCYVELKVGQGNPVFGVGQDKNISRAAIKALLNGINRVLQ
ncbi:2-isopropylmalate synthase [Methylophaga frappieri]|uniref:2-isopropylmalate synthase n=1 Tax=Methylophaga frappieri (strain ATCC BAA-2434 / DSM 25690 / JAM7) TaxID=754477 RepID=I1YHR5_METFJ|nr:2-isopropylmalate synthase [Methylophaga frappieri]